MGAIGLLECNKPTVQLSSLQHKQQENVKQNQRQQPQNNINDELIGIFPTEAAQRLSASNSQQGEFIQIELTLSLVCDLDSSGLREQVDDSQQESIFYHFCAKQGSNRATMIEVDNSCAICNFQATSFSGVCCHIASCHGIFEAEFAPSTISLSLSHKYTDVTGDFQLPSESSFTNIADEASTMLDGLHRRGQIYYEIDRRIRLDSKSRMSASPVSNEKAKKSKVAGIQQQVARTLSFDSAPKQTNLIQAKKPRNQKKKKAVHPQLGVKFFKSYPLTPLTEEQRLKRIDSEEEEKLETYKRIAWAEINEQGWELPEKARELKYLWNIFVKQNPIYADKFLFEAYSKFVEENLEQLANSWEMFAEVQMQLRIYCEKFSLLNMKQVAALLRPIRKFMQESRVNGNIIT
eukprot:TRINITY_DN72840_c0_g1_i1.p1 TRINITY_DN72840_c0_g1~~TRINITY_DN72840_c0_g1_i1.p1  ORF type:complete len:406 (-),score=44.08 TRINITY_DN72840_c0_g1_i1:214-1431(-)